MRALLIGAACLLAGASQAHAQGYPGADAPRAGSVEIGGSIVWTGGYDAGSRPALETPNSTNGAPPLTLFTTASRVVAGPGAEARVGVYLSHAVSAEATFQFSRPILRTSLADDFENAPAISAEETVSSYIVGGSVLYHFGSGHVAPFVLGGAGYVRQLHEGNTEVLTGTEFHGGAGVNWWLGSGARHFALRFDAQASSRSQSVAFDQKRRLVTLVGGGIAYRF